MLYTRFVNNDRSMNLIKYLSFSILFSFSISGLHASSTKNDLQKELFESLSKRKSVASRKITNEEKEKVDELIRSQESSENFLLSLIAEGALHKEKVFNFLGAFRYVNSKKKAFSKELITRELLKNRFSDKEIFFLLSTRFKPNDSISLQRLDKILSKFIDGHYNCFEVGLVLQHILNRYTDKFSELNQEFRALLKKALLIENSKWRHAKFINFENGLTRLLLPQTYFFEKGFLSESEYLNFIGSLVDSSHPLYLRKSSLNYFLEHNDGLSKKSLELLHSKKVELDREEKRQKDLQNSFIYITSLTHENGSFFLLKPKQNIFDRRKPLTWKLGGSKFYELIGKQMFIDSKEDLLNVVLDPGKDRLLSALDIESTVKVLSENYAPLLINYLLYADISGEKFIFSKITQSSWLHLGIQRPPFVRATKLQIYRFVENRWRYFGDNMKYVIDDLSEKGNQKSPWKLNTIQELLKESKSADDVLEFSKKKKFKIESSFFSKENALEPLRKIGIEP